MRTTTTVPAHLKVGDEVSMVGGSFKKVEAIEQTSKSGEPFVAQVTLEGGIKVSTGGVQFITIKAK